MYWFVRKKLSSAFVYPIIALSFKKNLLAFEFARNERTRFDAALHRTALQKLLYRLLQERFVQ